MGRRLRLTRGAPDGFGRTTTVVLGASLLAIDLAACSSAPPGPGGVPYLDDVSYRRAELTASLVNPSNGYSQQRLAHYATNDQNDWDRLPEWNPVVEAIATGELDAPGGAKLALSNAAHALSLPDAVSSENDPALVALGEAAFRSYPVQLSAYFEDALKSRAAASGVGLWLDDARGVGGLVRARMADGSVQLAVTCSTCHGAPGGAAGGGIVDGLPNAELDVGAARLAGETVDPTTAASLAAWGPGRLDVTTTAGTEPVRIADLRPVRWLTYLQADATLQKRDLTTLAIRIETLAITSSGLVVRPPRVVALALAAYVSSLADALPEPSVAQGASPQGAQVFQQNCTMCHTEPAFTGDPVPLGVVGTDPTLGLSASRGTGFYRVPSLHGVGSRGPLLHDGTVPSVSAMFDPSRPTSAFQGRLHGAGAVEGHPFGLGLADADRAALIAYLQAL
jgi:mono/diheme cytochrome c family protein